jgi:beta-glucosidase-like glycosyl hydrolase
VGGRVCLFVCLPACLPVCLSACLPAHLSVYLYVCISVCLSVLHNIHSPEQVLRTTFLLGELDGPQSVPQQTWGPELVDSKAHQALALKAAQSSIVLLANHNRTLPLATKTAGSGVAFIGPQANVSQGLLSDYHGLRMGMEDQSPLHVRTLWNIVPAAMLTQNLRIMVWSRSHGHAGWQ